MTEKNQEHAAVSRIRHGNKYWQRFAGYAFARSKILAPLAVQEFASAAVSLPIGFIMEGGSYTPVAVLGVEPGKNLFTDADGHWLGRYVPAIYRAYPFSMGTTENGQKVLCVDEIGGLINDTTGQVLFTEDGELSPQLAEVLKFLSGAEEGFVLGKSLCKKFQEKGLIEKWPIVLQTEEGEKHCEGLFRINPGKLDALSVEDIQELHQNHALFPAYCQVLSMQNIQEFGRLAQLHDGTSVESAAGKIKEGLLDMDFSDNGGTLDFSNFE